MREEVRDTRKMGRWFTNNREHRKKEECSTWNNRTWKKRKKVPHGTIKEARKNHLGGGGFGVMNYNKNGEISENPHGRIDVLTLDYQLILLYMIYYDLFNDK